MLQMEIFVEILCWPGFNNGDIKSVRPRPYRSAVLPYTGYPRPAQEGWYNDSWLLDSFRTNQAMGLLVFSSYGDAPCGHVVRRGPVNGLRWQTGDSATAAAFASHHAATGPV